MSRVADLLLAEGRTRADLARQRADIWGNAISHIAQLPGQIYAQQQQQKRLTAQMALEQAREARLRGQEDRATALEQHAQAEADAFRQALHAGFSADPTTFDLAAATQKAAALGHDQLVPKLHEVADKYKPKLEKVTTRTPEGGETTQFVQPTEGATFESAPPRPKLGAPQYMMVGGKRTPIRTDDVGNVYDILGKKLEGVAIAPDEPPMTPYQRAELGIQRERLAKEGAKQGRPVTSGDAGKIAEYDSSLDDLQTLKTAISGKGATGIGAQIAAATPYVTQLTGWGAEAKERQAVIDRVKQVIGKALEGGVLRKEDEVKYEKILPRIGDAPEVAATKLEGLDKAIRQKRARHLESLNDAGYDTSRFERTERPGAGTPKADPLGLFGPKP